MNVLLISHYFLPQYTAGTEIYTYRLGMALGKRGHSVHVLAGAIDPNARKPIRWDEDVLGLPVTFFSPKRETKLQHLQQSLHDGQRPEFEPMFEQVLDQIQPQVVHIQQLSTLSVSFIHIAKARGIPVVVMLNDYWFLCQRVQMIKSDGERCDGFDAKICADCLLATYRQPVRTLGKPTARKASERRRQVLGDALRAADLILSPSRHLIKVHEEHGIPKDTIIHCDYGFPEPESISPVEPSVPLKVGYLGSIVPHKGLHILIDAINRLDGKAHLTIHGSPSANHNFYRDLWRKNLDMVKFAGVSDPQNPYPTIAAYDVMVVPSLWEENSPLVIHEAHAAGRPVIASRVGGAKELIKDGVDGFLVPPGDVQALADVLGDLADDPQKLVDMSSQSRPHKPIDGNAEEIEGFYYKLQSKE